MFFYIAIQISIVSWVINDIFLVLNNIVAKYVIKTEFYLFFNKATFLIRDAYVLFSFYSLISWWFQEIIYVFGLFKCKFSVFCIFCILYLGKIGKIYKEESIILKK
jgi:hypothetical protein